MESERSQPDPTIEAQVNFYDEWNAAHRGGELDQIEPEIRERGLRAVEMLRREGRADLRILEVGCGTGWLSGELCSFGRLTAIDLSPRAIDIARARGYAARFLAGDFLTHDFAGESFDAIVCIETLFYVSDQQGCVRRMAELLRPGGLLVLTAINKYVYEHSSDVGPPKPGQVRHWLDRGALRALLAPQFAIESMTTLGPRGDRGILRLVNSYRVNALLDRTLGASRVRRLKESAGLGGGIVLVARRR